VTLSYTSVLRWPDVAQRASEDAGVRQMFVDLNKGLEAVPENNAHGAQPYVTPRTWLLFQAYQSVLAYAFLQMTMPPRILREANFTDLLVVALPDWR
jgi:hypothetical protein